MPRPRVMNMKIKFAQVDCQKPGMKPRQFDRVIHLDNSVRAFDNVRTGLLAVFCALFATPLVVSSAFGLFLGDLQPTASPDALDPVVIHLPTFLP
jgi:hypothetical protein